MKVPEQYRVKKGILASDESFGNNGCFIVPHESYELNVIASDGGGWEHVSVSMPTRTPNWNQMWFIKDLFFEDTDTVIQYHPAKDQYVNEHDHCLHLWKPTGEVIPIPPSEFVGFRKK